MRMRSRSVFLYQQLDQFDTLLNRWRKPASELKTRTTHTHIHTRTKALNNNDNNLRCLLAAVRRDTRFACKFQHRCMSVCVDGCLR